MGFPHGYHITFGTYGNRLHGSDKPHVDRDHNHYGEPFADPGRHALTDGDQMGAHGWRD